MSTPEPYLVESLVQLRTEFNHENPARYKGADGWIGDTRHQQENPSSKHNPDSLGRVRAIDIDKTGPWPVPFTEYIDYLADRCRTGAENRLELIIWDREICSRDSKWQWVTYTGTSDPHTGHAHLQARNDGTGYTSGKTFGLSSVSEDIVTPDDIKKIAAASAAAVWDTAGGSGANREDAFERLANIDSRIDSVESKIDQILAKLETPPEPSAS